MSCREMPPPAKYSDAGALRARQTRALCSSAESHSQRRAAMPHAGGVVAGRRAPACLLLQRGARTHNMCGEKARGVLRMGQRAMARSGR